MSSLQFDAVIFDLDGVVTKTALVHSSAWKMMFDEFLTEYSKQKGISFKEFTHAGDYLPFVDGKPRYKGVEDFLTSRNIKLPYGDPTDSPNKRTICGLGNRKDYAFNETLQRDGVGVYESTVNLIKQLKANKVKVGVASSSKNCAIVLQAAGLVDLFETRVDGLVSAELKLKGKPEPDIFIAAADNLGTSYAKSVIVEDAVSGVQAGKKGDFGLVLGVTREDNERELLLNGADLVVADLAEISIEGINDWFSTGIETDSWTLTYQDFEPSKERTREALLTVGNGYFGTRGAMEETPSSSIHSPGTYIAGLYNRLVSKVGDRMVENEDFVNAPNWLPVTFRIEKEPWFDFEKVKFLEFNRTLDFRTGVYNRRMVFEDQQGRITSIESRRFASMNNPHQAALQYTITPISYSGNITIRSGINGLIINEGVERYSQLNQTHLKPCEEGHQANIIHVVVETTESGIAIAQAVAHRLFLEEDELKQKPRTDSSPSRTFQEYTTEVIQGQSITLEKIVAIYTSKHDDVNDPTNKALKLAKVPYRYEELAALSADSWQSIWDKIDIKIEGSRLDQKLLRLHLYHIMVSASPYNKSIDASFTARGLHGEAYRGHIFWDELFILPFYNIHFPETAKATLMYRYNRIEKAREYASQNGYKGAMFPWQSGSDGREETQVVHLNPLTGEWGDDFSSLQRHVSLAIAYNVWNYVNTTGDMKFMREYGIEMLLEICRFWASTTTYNRETKKYSIPGVMGPDEFHEKYPDSDKGGVCDNAYTNILVAWVLKKTCSMLEIMNYEVEDVKTRIHLTTDEINNWKDIAHNLHLDISDEGIIAQYDGYFKLKELDWNYYRAKYGNISRLDRILKSEAKSLDEYQASKQADTLMIFYILDESDVKELLSDMGYNPAKDLLKRNMDYYLGRTSHGSTLSRVVHAQLANMTDDDELSSELYEQALSSDYNDIQGGTTAEGIHLGVMAGTILIALQSFAGLNLSSDYIRINPRLLKKWQSISFNFSFRGNDYSVKIVDNTIELTSGNQGGKLLPIEIAGKLYKVSDHEMITVAYNC